MKLHVKQSGDRFVDLKFEVLGGFGQNLLPVLLKVQLCGVVRVKP